MSKVRFQASPELSRYGKAGPPVQYSDTITIEELKELIKENDIKPDKLFTKEQILSDPKVKDKIDALIDAEIKADKLKEDEMIPGDDKPKTLTPEEKKKQAEENRFVPDDEPGGDDDLIPD